MSQQLQNNILEAFLDSFNQPMWIIDISGKLLMMKLDEKTIALRDIVIHREFYALGTNNSSIYSIDCDYKGELLLASIYENVKFYLNKFYTCDL